MRGRTGLLRWFVPIAALVGVMIVAPALPPTALLPVSIAWLLTVGYLVARGLARIRRTWGSGLAVLMALVGIGGPMSLVGVDWSGAAGTYLPCRRNWAWLPSYLLRSSPTQSVTTEIQGTRVKVCYGSPRARGRKMIGGRSVPFGHLWRTGANEPTTIQASGPLVVAGIPIGQGKAALYTVPGPETWEIVLNRSTGQWGIESEYTPEIASQEIGRAIVTSQSSGMSVEVLSVTIEQAPERNGTNIVLRWETTEVRIPIAPNPR